MLLLSINVRRNSLNKAPSGQSQVLCVPVTLLSCRQLGALKNWIPAYAGMTKTYRNDRETRRLSFKYSGVPLGDKEKGQ